MNRVVPSARRHVAVAVLFLCMLALALCQIMGPMARLSHAFGPADLTGSVLAPVSERGAHTQAPSRCASIKLGPVEITTAALATAEVGCAFAVAMTSTPPQGADLGVPTPPPRRA